MALPINPNGVVVDIDDTLCHTSVACAQHLGQRFSPSEDIPFDQLLAEFGYVDKVPRWANSECLECVKEWLSNPDFLLDLPVIPEAQVGLAEVLKHVPLAFYQTSRMPFAYQVSVDWLDRHGFPAAEVICRPLGVEEPDWKVRFLAKQYPDTLGLIDNELHVPPDVEYNGKLWELILHKKVTPKNDRLIECHSWEGIIATL